MKSSKIIFSFIIILSIITISCSSTKQKEMKNTDALNLIYIMDPHCGWCYGNAENINAINNEFEDKINIDIKVGGMWLGENAPSGGAGFNQFISTHAPRMEATTGVYLDKSFSELTNDSTYVFSSLEPSAAIVLVKELAPEKAIQFTKEVQKAIFNEGKRLDVLASYIPILEMMDINKTTFEKNWMSENNISKTKEEFASVQSLANGFPTLILDDSSGKKVLASGYFDKTQMISTLNSLISN